jgi:outer membrane lipoprotein-sorting protein
MLTMVLIGVLVLSATALAGDITGRQIIENVDNAPVADDARLLMTMTLINSQGQSLERQMWSWKQGTTKTALVFLAPDDVKGTAFLTIELPDYSNDMWLYLPSLGLTKHIDADSKTQSFMGSDFTYNDMGHRNINDYDYQILREETYDGHHVYVVKATAHDPQDAGYSYMISWIRDDIWKPVKVEYYDLASKLEKIQTNAKIEEIDGYWAVTEMEMENVQTNHKTIVTMTKIEVNTGVPADVFTSAWLPKLLSLVPQQ